MPSLTPVCVKCGREMYCAKNGVLVYHPFEHATAGLIQEGNIVYTDRMIEGSWKEGDIDFLTIGDKYRCGGCGAEVVVDCGELLMATPFTRWTQKALRQMLKKADEKIEIRRK